jgi:hypothetical protein
MSKPALVRSRSVLASLALFAGFIASASAGLIESYGKLPLQFEQNQGQTDKSARFLARGPGYSLYLTTGEAVLMLSKPAADARAPAKSVAIRMGLVDAAPKPVVTGRDELPGKTNYFIGRDPAKWRTHVPTYAKVHYRNVYPGIDLVYYGKQRQLEYDFVVAPGADPKKIVLGFKGADKLEIDARGDLVLHTADGDVRQHKPVVYQEVDGNRQEIAGSYVRKSANRVGFHVAAYDASRPLVIDPVLVYSTYLGGGGVDGAGRIAVDVRGNAYVVGNTGSPFPTTPGAFQGTPRGSFDAFVAKFDSTGSLVYSTYLGGAGFDTGTAIAVDHRGNAYVTGVTSSADWPTTPGAFQPSFAGPSFFDAFVAKLDPSGSGLVYSTYLGGNGIDQASGIAVDADDSAYVTGSTTSTNFPTTAGAFQTTLASTSSFNADAFVTKLNAAGTALVYSTYLGGSGNDQGAAIAVDPRGNAYTTGLTRSIDFPTTAGAFQTTFASASIFIDDAFVTKLNSDGSGLVYSTYLGGGNEDRGVGIAVDERGNVYATGLTNSSNFPTANAFQPVQAGGLDPFGEVLFDAFVTKLDPSGSVLVYSTYLGGGGDDRASDIAIDPRGNAYIVGITDSVNFPVANAVQSAFAGGRSDAFVTKLDSAGASLVYSTYLGGEGLDQGLGIAVDAPGRTYISGNTNSIRFPTVNAFQASPGGRGDAFVAKIVDDEIEEEVSP